MTDESVIQPVPYTAKKNTARLIWRDLFPYFCFRNPFRKKIKKSDETNLKNIESNSFSTK
jgi:hypothetical protein